MIEPVGPIDCYEFDVLDAAPTFSRITEHPDLENQHGRYWLGPKLSQPEPLLGPRSGCGCSAQQARQDRTQVVAPIEAILEVDQITRCILRELEGVIGAVGGRLFFKWIKQHLRIKSFFGTSENAVKSQIWIAISVHVLVAIIRKRLDLKADLYTILQILSLTLFEKTHLDQLLRNGDIIMQHPDTPNQMSLCRPDPAG